MYRLLRVYALASAGLFLVVAVALVWLYREDALQRVVRTTQEQNIALAQALANSMWDQFSDHVTTVSETDGDALRAHLETGRIDAAMRSFVAQVPVLKVKIYNLDGVTIYSSEPAQIGDDKSDSPGFVAAAGMGEVRSKYSYRETFFSFEGLKADRHVVESYLPIRRGHHHGDHHHVHPIEGVFEIYSDVSLQFARVHKQIANFILVLGAIFVAFYTALYLIVKFATRIIDRQYSELLATQEQLTQHRDQLEQALKAQTEYNALQREFVSMASHEFRTPLTIIDAAAQRLLRRFDRFTPDQIREKLGNIREAVSRMTALIESTLSAAQLNAGTIEMKPQPTDLALLLKTVCARQQELSASHRIELDLQDLPEKVDGDPRLLEQVFSNLLSNAVKYSPGKPLVEVRACRDGDQVVVSVQDHGVGIPAAEVPRIFQRYFRAKTAAGIAGTGIGLNLAQELVDMHGGTIGAASIEGQGSIFTVHLPVSPSRHVRMHAGWDHFIPAGSAPAGING